MYDNPSNIAGCHVMAYCLLFIIIIIFIKVTPHKFDGLLKLTIGVIYRDSINAIYVNVGLNLTTLNSPLKEQLTNTVQSNWKTLSSL